MKAKDYSSGAVLFEDAIDLDQDFVTSWIESMWEEHHHNFRNEYTFSEEEMITAPTRLGVWGPKRDGQDLEFNKKLEKAMLDCVAKYMEIYPMARQSCWAWSVGHVAVYDVGQCIGEHTDQSVDLVGVKYWAGETPRAIRVQKNSISMSLFLNDDYEGGEMVLRHAKSSIPQKAGSVLAFPSSYVGAHEVTPVTSGRRCSYLQSVGTGPTDPAEIESYIKWQAQGRNAWLPPELLESGLIDERNAQYGVTDNSDNIVKPHGFPSPI